MQANIIISLNGEKRTIPENTNIFELLAQLEIEPRNVAIELNLELIVRSLWTQTVLHNNDRIEIVQFVGGGF